MPNDRKKRASPRNPAQSTRRAPDRPRARKDSELPVVGVVMGSESDWETMRDAVDVCQRFKVTVEYRVVSAHRTPEDMMAYAREAAGRGLEVIVAGAGGAAHLPGMIASLTPLPVIGVPVQGRLQGLDSLLSIVQMPMGVPVATVAVGGSGNAGLLAVRILALRDGGLRERLSAFHEQMAGKSRRKKLSL